MLKDNAKTALLSKPYVWMFWLWFVLYTALNIWVNDAIPVLKGLFNLNLWIALPYTFFNLIIAFLLALVVNMIIIRVKEIKRMSGTSGLAAAGMVGGLITGTCPGCLAGLLPAILGVFGAQFVLSDLPFYGMEIQVVSIALMLVGAWYLQKPVVCKIQKTDKGTKNV